MSIPRIVIAGTHSGVGKTTVAAGVMAALRRKGLRVAPFKVGPDYLDPGYHQAASGRASTPLDAWMLGENGMRESFARGTRNADVAVIEGMMGLHDGAAPDSDVGSTAQAAKLLRAPVVLVLDGSALARSAGALALGYRTFDPDVRVVGVIANRVAGEGHARFLRPAIEEQAGLPLLGWLPTEAELAIPERHLGLVGAGEQPRTVFLMERLADAVEGHLDLSRLLELAREAPPLDTISPPRAAAATRRVRIAVARDEAFCFYYPDNLALLEAAGAELVPFSALRDPSLPPDVRGLYLGGGYPELHAERLAANNTLLREIAALRSAGVPIYAECGGFMALCKALVDADGREHRMAGIIPGRTRIMPSLQAIGYREVRLVSDSPLGPGGDVARGHEFRHSRFEGAIPPEQAAFRMGDGVTGYADGSLLASYVHLHFGSNPSLAERFVHACRER